MRIKLKKLSIKWPHVRKMRMPNDRQELKQMSRHPHAVPVITLGVLVILTGVFLGFKQIRHTPPVKDSKIVIVSYDHQKQIVPSRDNTVGTLLQKLHITLHEGDVVEPDQNAVIDQDQFRINVYRAVPVTVVDGEHKTFASSAATTPRAIAQQTGATVYPEDIVSTDPAQNFIKNSTIGEQVVIKHATPINVDLYGTPVVLRTHAKTVGELIKEKNIKLEKNDKVSPAPNTPISPGQPVAFIRTGTKVQTVTEEIATPVQTINEPSLAYGTKAVRQQGSPGQQTVTYQIAINNNVETGRSIIQKVVTKQPVTQIEVMGISLSGIKGDMALAGIAPGDYTAVDYIVSHESGWRPNATNASGSWGLCQATPGGKMASAGADWRTNPITQLKWCSGYAKRYGGWQGSYQHWLSHHNW